jgi:hypothetical protein
MRKTFVYWAPAFVLAFVATGCGGGGPVKDNIAAYKEATEVLATIKDKASAEAAKPKLAKIGERIKANNEKITKGEAKPTEEDGKQLVEAQSKHGAELMRVAKVDGGADAIKDYAGMVSGINMKMPDMPKMP